MTNAEIESDLADAEQAEQADADAQAAGEALLNEPEPVEPVTLRGESPAAPRRWTKTEIVDGDTVEWAAEIDPDGDVRWYCDFELTGGEWDNSPERIAQIIMNLDHDGYREV